MDSTVDEQMCFLLLLVDFIDLFFNNSPAL